MTGSPHEDTLVGEVEVIDGELLEGHFDFGEVPGGQERSRRAEEGEDENVSLRKKVSR